FEAARSECAKDTLQQMNKRKLHAARELLIRPHATAHPTAVPLVRLREFSARAHPDPAWRRMARTRLFKQAST
ncbi:MAG: hypothetical protein JW741_30560, partial [Sedimentisphaerales bacterium]|nr:hypothetical protein [Sedimentisphaerales bacterium]